MLTAWYASFSLEDNTVICYMFVNMFVSCCTALPGGDRPGGCSLDWNEDVWHCWWRIHVGAFLCVGVEVNLKGEPP